MFGLSLCDLCMRMETLDTSFHGMISYNKNTAVRAPCCMSCEHHAFSTWRVARYEEALAVSSSSHIAVNSLFSLV